jgi:glutathione S-transferase
MSLVLYVGSKRLSSWSLRPYLALAHAFAPELFETRTIRLDQPETTAEILKVNPTGRVPVLYHHAPELFGEQPLVIWDSLAICEYLAELEDSLWPADVAARARARAISAEMHSGFAALRREMPMDLCASKPGVGHTPEALADVARVHAIWRECLAQSGGPFLFGAFSIADAMFAPPVTRFRTYGVPLDAACQAYADAITSLPAMRAWQRDADAES